MKKTVLCLTLLAACACMAQTPNSDQPEKFRSNVQERPGAPTATDLYCSGFVSREKFDETKFVVGSKVVPNASRFVGNDTVFLTGQGYEVGQTIRLIRRVKDRNSTENFDGQHALLESSGANWIDTSRVKVTNLVDGYAVARIVFSCADAQIGDIAVAFEEKSAPAFSHSAKDFVQFGVATSSVKGKIIGANGFDYLLGTRSRVYVNLGGNHNLKVGDYLRITRGNAEDDLAPIDAVSTKATIVDESSDKTPKPKKGAHNSFPRRGLGELMIIDVHPETATGIITLALEDVHLGDQVELEGAAPAVASEVPKHSRKWYKPW